MTIQSAGILLYQRKGATVEVLLVHPGGPFWTGKDSHAWSIPKGEFSNDEEPLAAAKREFTEETGHSIDGETIALSPRKQPSGKMVYAWAVEKWIDPRAVKSNNFELEWPPKSGKKQMFPEIDKAEWFELALAKEKIHKGQIAILDELAERLGASSSQQELF
jgi:predicted NUDIX family NTP pyrophosphohydrolase